MAIPFNICLEIIILPSLFQEQYRDSYIFGVAIVMTYENDRAFPKNTYEILPPAIKSRQLRDTLSYLACFLHMLSVCFYRAVT